MSEGNQTDTGSFKTAVRYGSFLGLSRTTALGASVTVGLGVFVFLGLVLDLAGTRTPLSYILSGVVFLPLILAYAERALAISNGEGVFRLSRADDPGWFAYSDNWIALAGFAGVIGLLGWGIAFHLNLLLIRLFDFSLVGTFLAIGAILVVAVNRMFGGRGSWRTRVRLIYLSVPLLVILVAIGWFAADQFISTQFALRTPGNTVGAIAMLAGLLWGAGLILDQREKIRNPSRNLPLGLYISLLLGVILGLLAVLVVQEYPNIAFGDRLPLATIASQAGGVAELIYLIVGLLVCTIGLDRSLVSGLRLVGVMMEEGFIPSEFVIAKRFRPRVSRLALLTILSALFLLLIPFEILVNFVGLAFLLTTILVFGRDLIDPRSQLPDHPGIKLPFRPLFPALAIAISIYFSLALSIQIWMIALIWGAIGALYYFVYARRGGMEVRKKSHSRGEEIPRYQEKDYHILVDITHADDVLSLIRAGVRMAKSSNGQVLVIQVLQQVSHLPINTESRAVEKTLLILKNKINQVENDGVPIETLVRLAPSRVSGVLETVREEQIHLILVGWADADRGEEGALDEDINSLVQSAPCDVAVLRGKILDSIHTVTVSTRGGPHAGEALKYGRWLSEGQQGQVQALNIVRGTITSEIISQAERQLHKAIEEAGELEAYTPRVVQAEGVISGIVAESATSDLLLMGVSTQGLLDQAVLDGIPVDVARERPGPTLLVKHYEGPSRFWLRRLWEMVYSFFPTLTVGERADVERRIKRSAIANVDFYALIILSAVIAVLGLIQNSGAVIIGAMLVAPLMSPILAIAFGLVLGDIQILGQSGESTIKGVLVAIAVSVGVALVMPPLPVTAEILARTQPNLLDMIVALASGAAAAYALARKHLAAALPGVAIAAALVPPLCVVGYGLGYGMYDVAGGALLLFLTNLSAIVFSGASVFLLLGFRPRRAEFGQRIQRWITLSIVILVVIASPLAAATINLRNNLERERQVENVLNEVLEGKAADVENVTIQKEADGYLISGTIYAYAEITNSDMEAIQSQLSEAIEAPVTIRARVLDAELRIIGNEGELEVLREQ